MQGGQIGAPIGNSVPSEAASSRLTVSQRASPYLRSHATKGLPLRAAARRSIELTI
jgi:hypothetical protein